MAPQMTVKASAERGVREINKYGFKINELPTYIDSYFNAYLKEHPDIIADTESLAAYLGITRDELNALEGHKKVGRSVKVAKTRIAAIKKQLAYRGKLPAALLTFDLRNDHGYRDKPEDSSQTITVFKGGVLEWGV